MFFKNILMCFILITSLSVSNTYTGKASFYTNKTNRYNGHNKTANGEIFNENALTCASNKHKFNTLLRVENINNKKSVICRVNDTGGFGKYNRVIDLSKASFSKIANLKSGVVNVRISVVK